MYLSEKHVYPLTRTHLFQRTPPVRTTSFFKPQVEFCIDFTPTFCPTNTQLLPFWCLLDSRGVKRLGHSIHESTLMWGHFFSFHQYTLHNFWSMWISDLKVWLQMVNGKLLTRNLLQPQRTLLQEVVASNPTPASSSRPGYGQVPPTTNPDESRQSSTNPDNQDNTQKLLQE